MFEERPITEELLDKDYTASQLPDGRWFTRLPIAYDPETKRYKYKVIYGKNQKDTLKKTRLYIQSESKRAHTFKENKELFTSVFEAWLYDYKRNKVKSTTFDRYEQTYLYQILPHLAKHKLTEITDDDLQGLLKSTLDAGYSYSSTLKVYRLLKNFFSYQAKRKVISENPMVNVEMYSRDEVHRKQESLRDIREIAQQKSTCNMPLTETEESLLQSKLRICDKENIRFFSDEEIAKLKEVINNGYIRQGLSRSKNLKEYHFSIKQGEVFLLMLNTGLRAGEMLALQYCDIDWENKTIGIVKNIVSVKVRDENGRSTGNRKTKQGKVKTERSYQEFLAVNDTAIAILKRLRSKEPTDYEGYIIHNGNLPLSPRAFAKRFYNLLDGAGIEKTGLHTLRHTFASKLYAQTNGDTKLVSELLRHASVAFTAQTYIHLENKYKRKTLDSFEV